MAAIRIQSGDRNEASVIALSGKHITIGRSPTNTLQILDKTLSLHHAELIDEGGGHYQVHDLGSTTGVFVNGERVTAYHLRERCKLAFGTLECEFLAEIPPDLNISTGTLPARVGVSPDGTENVELNAVLTRLQSEIASLQEAAASEAEARAFAVAREQRENILSERESLRATVSQAQADLAALQTTRDELQRANDAQKAELDSSRTENTQLKERIEGLTRDSEALATLREEHSSLKNVHEQLETEMLQLKADRNTSRRENSKLQAAVEVQARELASLQESHASLTRKMATMIQPEEHQKLVTAHGQLGEELTHLKQNLADLTIDRDALLHTVEAQRADLDSLRTANAELEHRSAELTKRADEQAASARETQERLQNEISQIKADHEATLTQARANLAAVQTTRDELQRANDAQKAELDSTRTENTQLKERIEGLTRDSEALATLREEHSSLKNAHEQLETEMLQLKADRNTSRRENSKLQAAVEVQARELASLQESHASLSRKMATMIPLEEHQKLAAECASVKQAHAEGLEEITRLKQNLADLAIDREALLHTVEAQRTELATRPTQADLESLRAANTELESRAAELTKRADEQAASAKETQERLQSEISELNQSLVNSAADNASLQKTISTQRTELETRPTQADLDSLRIANAELESRTAELTKRADEQAASARETQERLQNEISQLKQSLADSVSDRESLQKTIATQRAELEASPKPAELDALRSTNSALEERLNELTKLAAEQAASAKKPQEELVQTVAQLKKQLTDLTADRDRLRQIADTQRAELERSPKAAELDSLRAANAKLEESINELTAEIADLKKTQAAAYIPREEHDKLLAEHAAIKESQRKRDIELDQVNRRLAESLTQHANVSRTLKAREDELQTLRRRPPVEAPVRYVPSEGNGMHTITTDGRESCGTIPSSGGTALEEALGELGFVIRPVKQ